MNLYMTSAQRAKCHAVIHAASASAAAIGAGLAQLPCSDNVVLVPLQTAMTVSLGKIFGIRLSHSAAEAVVYTGLSTVIGRGLSQVLVGWFPGVGNVINAATAAAVTETLGWFIAEDFAKDASYAA